MGRMINDQFITVNDVVSSLSTEYRQEYSHLFFPLEGRWDISSTEIRDKSK